MKPTVVLKIGGSLLDWPELPARLSAYLARRADPRPTLIVGGGPVADLVRALDRLHDLGPESAHALALQALDFTARALESLLDDTVVVERSADLAAAWAAGRIPILAARTLLDELDKLGPLPRTWDVTTDAIAARLADRLGAPELVLLKSASLPPGADRSEAARLGLVDPAFEVAARALRSITYVNLREPEPIARPL